MKKTIRDIDVKGKRVLVRVDFNVPLDIKTGAITDDTRIRATLPTITYLLEHQARVILCSHLGRPDGKVVKELRLAPVARRLAELIHFPVMAADDCVGPEVQKVAFGLQSGDILLLENLRFHDEEEKNDPVFSQKLARLGEIYVDDAFGTAHRSHASTVGVARYLPAVAGFLMEKELEELGQALSSPEHPFCSIVGGAKVSDKLGLLLNIVPKVDCLFVGGGMATTFLKAKGYEVGHSLIDDKVDVARQVMEEARQKGIAIILPEDLAVAAAVDEKAEVKIVPATKIPLDYFIVDIGPKTIERFSNELKKAKTVLWNGPMGIYEIPKFAGGTKAIALLLAQLKAKTIIGGGSTAEIVEEMGLADRMTHVSTGGGASLMFLEGKILPGIAVLLDR